MNGLALTLPVALVAHYVLQVFVGLYVVAAHDVGGILDNLFGQSRLACYLDGEG